MLRDELFFDLRDDDEDDDDDGACPARRRLVLLPLLRPVDSTAAASSVRAATTPPLADAALRPERRVPRWRDVRASVSRVSRRRSRFWRDAFRSDACVSVEMCAARRSSGVTSAGSRVREWVRPTP